jgi:hypothetical protein
VIISMLQRARHLQLGRVGQHLPGEQQVVDERLEVDDQSLQHRKHARQGLVVCLSGGQSLQNHLDDLLQTRGRRRRFRLRVGRDDAIFFHCDKTEMISTSFYTVVLSSEGVIKMFTQSNSLAGARLVRIEFFFLFVYFLCMSCNYSCIDDSLQKEIVDIFFIDVYLYIRFTCL